MDSIYTQHPSVALVIGTFGSVPYIHMQLEARQRFYPQVPVLVHDDGSPHHRQLAALCQRYGANFHYSTVRAPQSPPGLGDLACFVQGLMWSQKIHADILVKFSRRWIVMRDWVTELQALAHSTQYPTYSSFCTSYGFGFRSECLAMHTKTWMQSNFLEDSLDRIARAVLPLPEHYLHLHASAIFDRAACDRCREVDVSVTRDKPFGGCLGGYGQWSLMGTSRHQQREHCLWHDSNTVGDYRAKMQEFGHDYADWSV